MQTKFNINDYVNSDRPTALARRPKPTPPQTIAKRDRNARSEQGPQLAAQQRPHRLTRPPRTRPRLSKAHGGT
eukprot:11218759-Lingulodinium_polyedra.AAC.1